MGASAATLVCKETSEFLPIHITCWPLLFLHLLEKSPHLQPKLPSDLRPDSLPVRNCSNRVSAQVNLLQPGRGVIAIDLGYLVIAHVQDL